MKTKALSVLCRNAERIRHSPGLKRTPVLIPKLIPKLKPALTTDD